MAFLTDEKLLIVGAGGMIGSNMVQSALMLGLTPNICLYDIYEPGVHGVYDEMCHCAFPGANLSYTVNPEEAFTGAKYIISPNVDEKFAAYDRNPKPRIGFRYSFAYSIILMGVGLALTLLYVLFKG